MKSWRVLPLVSGARKIGLRWSLTVPHVGCAQPTDKSSNRQGVLLTAAAYDQNVTRRVVLAEPVGAVDGEQLREPRRARWTGRAVHSARYKGLGRRFRRAYIYVGRSLF
jgi:hypothetical protein